MTSEGLRETTPSGDAQSVAGQLLPKGIRFVEFYGLPGIGKTTASSVLAARLQQGGCVVDEQRITWEDCSHGKCTESASFFPGWLIENFVR